MKGKIDMWHFDSHQKLMDFVNSNQDQECYHWENIQIVYDVNPKFKDMNWCLFFRRKSL